MKAVFFRKHGGNEVLEYGDWPTPEPGPGEVRVSIRAAALNHLDIFVRNGIPDVPLPQVPGADGSGVVDAAGAGVEGISPGDRVLIQPGLFCNACEFCRGGEQSLCVKFRIVGEHVPGTFAEHAVVPARNVFPIPHGLSFEQAAAFPLVYQTAWRMLIGRARLRPGETVLIHGAGGGVGGAAMEIALLAGARVFATTSGEEKAARVKEAGAELVIDYTKDDVAKTIRARTAKRGVDVVVDSVGEKTWMSSILAAARGGRIVTCGATSGPNPKEDLRQIFWKQISILGSTMASDREFRALLSAVAAGKLKPRIDRAFPLSQAREAYARMEEGRQHGKIVLVPEGAGREWPDGD
ncbi:MAG TPA: zinc-binding dehydrogenase [Thermoanaerobaculia bacterium]|nr:zinc-binding dehydrogenase [Thermoanaerobaculia bacterium]